MKFVVLVLCFSSAAAIANLQMMRSDINAPSINGTIVPPSKPDFSGIMEKLKNRTGASNFMSGNSTGEMKTPAFLTDHFPKEQHGGPSKGHGRGGMKFGSMMPPFMQNVTDECRVSFSELCMGAMNKTVSEMKSEITEWGKTCNKSEEIANLTATMETKREEIKANITSLINSLPSHLKSLEKIETDESMTLGEMMEARKEFLDKIEDPKVADVLQFVAKTVMGDLMRSPFGDAPQPKHDGPMITPQQLQETKDKFKNFFMNVKSDGSALPMTIGGENSIGIVEEETKKSKKSKKSKGKLNKNKKNKKEKKEKQEEEEEVDSVEQ